MRSQVKKLLGQILSLEKENKALQQENQELKQRVDELSWDSAFGMWTRGAFLQFCRVMPRGQRVVVFIDLNDIHTLNHVLGYKEVDRRVREIFSIPFRKSDIVARWYSGDEIVILFDSDMAGAEKKIAELKESARKQDMDFEYEISVWKVGRTTINEVIDELSEKCVSLRVKNEISS